jgi:hypothetical protein
MHRSTIRGVPDLNRTEATEEGNLLIEAVSLLVQRQRETESWVAEQIWQAEERANAAERRYAELDTRLVDIEEHVARLAHDLEPSRQEPGVQERLTRLREQVEGLKSSAGDGRGTRSTPVGTAAPAAPPLLAAVPSEAEASPPRETPPSREPASPREPAQVRPSRIVRAGADSSGSAAGFWELLGATPQDRFGAVLIFAGAVAVLYALLLQVRF